MQNKKTITTDCAIPNIAEKKVIFSLKLIFVELILNQFSFNFLPYLML